MVIKSSSFKKAIVKREAFSAFQVHMQFCAVIPNMFKRSTVILAIFGLMLFGGGKSEGARTVTSSSIRVQAQVENGNAIRLNWSLYNTQAVTAYEVLRKLPADGSWTTTLVAESNKFTGVTYLDTTATPGELYEYRVRLVSTNVDYNNAHGFTAAGIAVAPVHSRGRLILVVDDTMLSPLETEIERFKRDLMGDGWQVVQVNAPRHVAYPTAPNTLTDATNPAAILKLQIRTAYNIAPALTKAVVLLGRIQVPYSGLTGYDGHGSRAFPTDVYYGNMSDSWLDTSVNNTTWNGSSNDSSAPPLNGSRNDNVPGDGKFDLNSVTKNELFVGRIDTSSMSSFGTETELLRRYLEKNHRYRRGFIPAEPRVAFHELHDSDIYHHGNPTLRRALSGMYPASAIVSATATLSGPDNLYLTEPIKSPHQWISVGSTGKNTGIGGMTSDHLANLDMQGVYFGLYGSHIGDWDQENNLMRSVVAMPRYGLVSYLGGQAALYTARMAMGGTIGEGQIIRLLASTTNPYRDMTNVSNRQGFICHSLMGDPTLGLNPIAPPKAPQFNGSIFSWSAPEGGADGYFVYSAPDNTSAFALRTPSAITATSYQVPVGDPAGTIYMARAVRLIAPLTGSYHALSQGVFSDQNLNGPPFVAIGVDRQYYETQNVNVSATVGDDGFRAGNLTGLWTATEGPGTVTFGNANAPTTTANFSVPGRYRLTYSASDGQLADTDTATYLVSADVFSATQDTYAAEDSPTTVRGSVTSSSALRSGPPTAGKQRVIYLMFDLGYGYRRPTNGLLRLRTYSSNVRAGTWKVHPVGDTSWSENTLTWANAPAYEPTPVAESRVITENEYNKFIDIDLGDYLKDKTGKVALALVTNSTDLSAYSRYVSAGIYAPQIVFPYHFTDTTYGLYWDESFTLANNTTNDTGATAWSVNTSAATPGASFIYSVRSNEFLSQYSRGEVVWSSEIVPLNPQKHYAATLRLRKIGTLEPEDYVRVYYRLNGGPETLLVEHVDDFTSPVTDAIAGLQGNTLQIIVRSNTNATDEGHAWDDVRIFSLDGDLKPQAYAQWARAYGLPINGSGAGDPQASPSGDGSVNLLKFALGLSPYTHGLAGRIGPPMILPQSLSPGAPTHLHFTVTRPEPAPTDFSLTPKASPDLLNWPDNAIEVNRTVNGDGTITLLYRDPVPCENASARFMRIEVAPGTP